MTKQRSLRQFTFKSDAIHKLQKLNIDQTLTERSKTRKVVSGFYRAKHTRNTSKKPPTAREFDCQSTEKYETTYLG